MRRSCCHCSLAWLSIEETDPSIICYNTWKLEVILQLLFKLTVILDYLSLAQAMSRLSSLYKAKGQRLLEKIFTQKTIMIQNIGHSSIYTDA